MLYCALESLPMFTLVYHFFVVIFIQIPRGRCGYYGFDFTATNGKKPFFFFPFIVIVVMCSSYRVRDIDHMLCGKELVSIFVLAYFANQNC